MWPMLPDYDFIVVNFGGYKMAKTLEEARHIAATMQGDKGTVYQKGFYSETLKMWVGKDKWFPVDKL